MERDPREFFPEAAAYFRPRSTITPSEWAERDRYVTAGDMKGARWTWGVTPYLREIVDWAYAPTARQAVVLKSTRVGYTQGVIGNIIGWSVIEDPCSVMVMPGDDSAAGDFARGAMWDILTSSPALAHHFPDTTMTRMRGDQRWQNRRFPGGRLEVLGAKDKNFRAKEFRRVLADELDDWFRRRSTIEGDPIKRLISRTDDYHDGIVIAGSSPTVTETSRIWRLWEASDQRKWFVPCPECGEYNPIEWQTEAGVHLIQWPKGRPALAKYMCPACGSEIPETKKGDMVRAGEWRPTAPGRFPGWHVHRLFSLINNARWGLVARQYLEAKAEMRKGNDELMRTWKNLALGLPWDDVRRTADVEKLEDRAEDYGVARDGSLLEVPEGVALLTAGVDIHARWTEVLVRGWGVGEESWDIVHQKVIGSPTQPSTWRGVDEVLTRRYACKGGRRLGVELALVDSGEFQGEVYGYCRRRNGVYPSKGDQGHYTGGPIAKLSTGKGRVDELVNIGTWTGKRQLMHRLTLTIPGPGYIHFRAHDRRVCNGFEAEYFKQFAAEELRNEKTRTGRVRAAWHQVRERNEAIDLHVLAAGAFALLGPSDRDLAARAEWVAGDPEGEEGETRRRRAGTVHPGYGRNGERVSRSWA